MTGETAGRDPVTAPAAVDLASVTIGRAQIDDATRIQRLVNDFADRGELLHRSLNELYEHIRDFFVARGLDGAVVGCAAVHVLWRDLAEVKSVAVAEEAQHSGLGARLVETSIAEGRALGVPTLFCLTYRPTFFQRFGFRQVDVMELPRKVWTECVRCSKFPDCGEIALVLPLSELSPWFAGGGPNLLTVTQR